MVALVPATPGYEDLPSVILHSHVDMVCIKAEGVEHDFSKDPIRAYAEGDKVLAEGTTLGGDDGIGMAFMLALMEDTESPHPALECVFTTDEETDMNGGVALDYSQFKSKYYINIDGCGVAIGSAGVFQGAGSSLISSILNLASMWGVRLTLTVPMVAHYGLRGAWIAMTIELFFRGVIFLFFLWRRYWLPKDLRP